jgi:hypothetical protein
VGLTRGSCGAGDEQAPARTATSASHDAARRQREKRAILAPVIACLPFVRRVRVVSVLVPDEQGRIAWIAVGKGHPVVDRNGEAIGKVSRVVADEQRDIFSGIAFRAGLLDPERFAPAALVDGITEEAVRLSIPAADAERLDAFEG